MSPSPAALAGRTVLVTADRRADDLGAALTRHGASVRHAPALSTMPHADDEALLAGTRALLDDPPDVLVVTTGVGFRGWLEAARSAGLDEPLLTALGGARLLARGSKAHGALQAAGLPVEWVAPSETTVEISDRLLTEGVGGLRVAVQHHGAGADGIDEALRGGGASVQSLVVYRWGPPRDPELLRRSVRDCVSGDVDAVVFTSAPGARGWLHAARETGLLEQVVAACAGGRLVAAAVGHVTAAPLVDVAIDPLVPERGRLGALVRALVARLS